MKTFVKILALPLLTLSILFSTSQTSYADTISLNTWDLVDSGKHLDWDGNSKYLSSFTDAVDVWEGYKSGIIREDDLGVIQDVAISDYYEVSSTIGETVAIGTIKFNDYHMENYDSDHQLNVAIHELGHALRLGHNGYSDVMYESITDNAKTTLSDNDKASYDAAYLNY